MKMFFTLYKTTNKINGKIYVGAHQTDDPNDNYLGSGELLLKAIAKYGRNSFNKEILSLHESSEEMFKEESKIVDGDFVNRTDTYNLKEGGFGMDSSLAIKNRQLTDQILLEKYGKEWRSVLGKLAGEGMKEKLKNPDFAREHRLKSIEFWTGRKHTEETKKKISEVRKEQMKDPANNPSTGTCWMYSLEDQKNIKVKKEEVDKYLSMGYTKGRKMKF